VMFMLLGAPGLVLATLARFTLREPRRPISTPKGATRSATAARQSAQPSLKEVCATLGANVTFRRLVLSLSVTIFFMYGILQWQPTFFIRSYGLTSGQIGIWFAAFYGLGGLLGTYAGGAWASRYAPGNERLQLKAVALAMAGSAVLSTGVYLSPSLFSAFGLMGCVMFAQTAINGPLYATLQTLVPERMRAVAIALVMLCVNLVGLGLGPLATGALSDALRPWAGQESLRYALLMLGPGLLLAAWPAWRASKTVAGDLAAVSFEEASSLRPLSEII
jgi:MFS family permease